MRLLTLSLATCFALTLSLLTAAADDPKPDAKLDPSKLPPPSSKTGVTYITDIQPIFEKSCVKCHGPERHKNSLHLDSLAGALKGGDNGVDIVPGKSGLSPMVYALAQIGDDDQAYMPPPERKSHIPPLTPEQIGLIRAWIDQGAK